MEKFALKQPMFLVRSSVAWCSQRTHGWDVSVAFACGPSLLRQGASYTSLTTRHQPDVFAATQLVFEGIGVDIREFLRLIEARSLLLMTHDYRRRR